MDEDDQAEVEAAVKKALQSANFSSFVPYEFTHQVKWKYSVSVNFLEAVISILCTCTLMVAYSVDVYVRSRANQLVFALAHQSYTCTCILYLQRK